MNTSISYRFPKKEKLKSRKQIDRLFAEGKSFSNFPLRVVWADFPAETALQVGVTVSTRYFKKAVDRNRIKRLLREAIRLQKHSLQHTLAKAGKSMQLFFLYQGNELPQFAELFHSTGKVFQRLEKMLHERSE